MLHSAVSILVNECYVQNLENIDICQEMLEQFVLGFQCIYGKQYVSHNVHNLLPFVKLSSLYTNHDSRNIDIYIVVESRNSEFVTPISNLQFKVWQVFSNEGTILLALRYSPSLN